MTPTPRWPGSSTIGDPPPNHDPVRPSEMTPRTEAGTKAGQRLLAGMPWMTKRERESWLRLILAIEAEAAAAERERLRAIETDRTLRFAFMTPDEWAADALADISAEDREALRRALLADPAEPEAGGDA